MYDSLLCYVDETTYDDIEMNTDFVYEDYKNLAEAQKIADVKDVAVISERLIKQNMEVYRELSK